MTEPTKHPGGRPRLYDDPEVFAAKTEAYFEERRLEARPPTMAGLCVYLGFTDRESFSKYEEYGEGFSRTVKKARLWIEEDRNERLMTKFTPGVIFDLKNNHGWKDKTELEHSGGLDLGRLTPEQRRARIDELERKRAERG